MAEEISELEGLLDLLEEGLDEPATLAGLHSRLLEMEHHLLFLAVDFHHGSAPLRKTAAGKMLGKAERMIMLANND